MAIFAAITWRRPAEFEAAELGEGHLRGIAIDFHLVVAPPGKAQQLRVARARAALWYACREGTRSQPTECRPADRMQRVRKHHSIVTLYVMADLMQHAPCGRSGCAGRNTVIKVSVAPTTVARSSMSRHASFMACTHDSARYCNISGGALTKVLGYTSA